MQQKLIIKQFDLALAIIVTLTLLIRNADVYGGAELS